MEKIREWYEKSNKVFEKLVAAYEEMSGNKVEVIIDRYVVWAGDSQILFSTSGALIKFMTTEIAEYFKQ